MPVNVVLKLVVVFGLASLTLVGCANKKSAPTAAGMEPTPSVTDVTPVAPTPATPAYAPAYAPAPEPTPVTSVSSVTPAAAGGASYTVQKGDTLFGIAKAKYNDGNQWKKIVAANPGLSPGNLKAGQKITLP